MTGVAKGNLRRLRLTDGARVAVRPRPDLGADVVQGEGPVAGRFFRLDPEGGAPREATAELRRTAAERLAAKRRVAAQRCRARRVALRRAAATSPLEQQQRHSPTEPVEILLRRAVVADGRGGVARVAVTRQQGARRVVDARLWDRLSPPAQRAAERIHLAFAIETRGLGARISGLGREVIDGGGQDQGEHQEQLLRDYWRWRARVRDAGLDLDAVLDVLAFGRSCAESDRGRRRRHGYTGGVLRAALDLYCRMKGWPVERGGA